MSDDYVLPPIEESTYHSVNAYLNNLDEKISIDRRVLFQLTHAYYSPNMSRYVNAKEMAIWCGMNEHKSIGAALSRLRSEYPTRIGYERREGQTHGVYTFVPMSEVGGFDV